MILQHKQAYANASSQCELSAQQRVLQAKVAWRVLRLQTSKKKEGCLACSESVGESDLVRSELWRWRWRQSKWIRFHLPLHRLSLQPR